MREGAYADDHMVIQNLSGQQLRTGQRLRDSQIVEDIVKSYLASGASMSEEKRVRFKETGAVWGSLIRWARRLVGTALDRRHQTGCLIFDPVALGHVDLRTLDSILGAFHHSFGHRPELMSVFHRSLRLEGWPSRWRGVQAPWRHPRRVDDGLLAPWLRRCPLESSCRRIAATDATPTAFGSCSAPCSGKVL